ncbi:MAG: DUF3467 domain-containing protein [Rhodanobacter sp.]|jgi:hypothetical protein
MENELKTITNMPGPVQRSTEYKDVYSNGLVLRMTAYDLSLVFMKNVFDLDGTSHPEEQVQVTMSPFHFKTMIANLSGVMAAYEGQFGKLPDVPAASTANLQAAFAQGNKKGGGG